MIKLLKNSLLKILRYFYSNLRVEIAYINWLLRRNKDFRMAEIYTDNMVLQCNKTLRIRGHANPGDHIVVSFAGKERETFTCSDGKWCVVFPPLKASNSGQTLSVRNGNRRLIYNNVLIGEVWLLTGASVMLMKLANAESYQEELQSWDRQKLSEISVRFFLKREIYKTRNISWPLWVCKAINRYTLLTQPRWAIVNRETSGEVPAYAYYHGKMLSERLHVPVGLICNALSGAPLDSWIEREYLAMEMPFLLEEGKENMFALEDWRSTMSINIAKSKMKRQKHYWHPSFCFESQIRSLEAFPVRGILYGVTFWVNGIENSLEEQFALFVRNMRDYWREDLPIYYMQLGRWYLAPSLPLLRDIQRRLEKSISGIKMVVSYDTFRKGVDRFFYHPYNRKDVGERFARLALYHIYGDTRIVPSGPLYHEATLRDNFIRIKLFFSEGLTYSDPGALEEFEVAGEDCCFQQATAYIVYNEIVIKCPDSISEPFYVRYGWKEYISSYIKNGEGIPLSTFYEKINK